MLDAMAERGIDVSACVVDPLVPTGATVILTSGSDRAMLTAMGTIGALDVDAVPRALVDRARHLHSGGVLPPGPESRPAAGVLRRGPRARPDDVVRHELGPDGAVGRRRPRDAPGRRRLPAERGGGPPDRAGRRRRRGGRWRSRGRVPRDGPTAGRSSRSSWARPARSRSTADGPIVRVPAMPIDPVDTTGAGDSFDAGFLRAWLDGADLRESLELGVVVRRPCRRGGRRRRRPADARRGAAPRWRAG